MTAGEFCKKIRGELDKLSTADIMLHIRVEDKRGNLLCVANPKRVGLFDYMGNVAGLQIDLQAE